MDVWEFLRSFGADVKLAAASLFAVFGFVWICYETGKRKLRGFLVSFIVVALATGGLNKIGMFSDISEETFDKYDRGAPSLVVPPSTPPATPPAPAPVRAVTTQVDHVGQIGQIGQIGNRATTCCLIGVGDGHVGQVGQVA